VHAGFRLKLINRYNRLDPKAMATAIRKRKAGQRPALQAASEGERRRRRRL